MDLIFEFSNGFLNSSLALPMIVKVAFLFINLYPQNWVTAKGLFLLKDSTKT